MTIESRLKDAERAAGITDAGDHEILIEIDWDEADSITAQHHLDGVPCKRSALAGLMHGAETVVKVDWGQHDN